MSRADQGAGRGANPRGMARSQTARPDRTSGDPLPAGQVAGFQLRDFVVAQAHVQRLGRVQEMPGLVAPTIGALTPGLPSSHASAICAGGRLRWLATAVTASATSKSAGRYGL